MMETLVSILLTMSTVIFGAAMAIFYFVLKFDDLEKRLLALRIATISAICSLLFATAILLLMAANHVSKPPESMYQPEQPHPLTQVVEAENISYLRYSAYSTNTNTFSF